MFVFQLFDMQVSDEFVEYASEGSLAIEVWGNRMKGFDSQSKVMLNWNVEPQQKGLHDRYFQGFRIQLYEALASSRFYQKLK